MVEKELIIPELNNETIESMIYIIRGQKSNVRFWHSKNICINNNYELVEINTDLDHVHLFIGLSPQDSIPVVMKTLKGVSARLLNSKHKNELSKVLYDGHIWSPSYYIATTSDNIMDNIKEYIINQGNEDLKKG